MTGRTAILVAEIPAEAITDALVAIELARERGVYDEEQIERLTSLVAALREAVIVR